MVLTLRSRISYDDHGRLVGLVHHQGESVLNNYAWTYDSTGLRRVV